MSCLYIYISRQWSHLYKSFSHLGRQSSVLSLLPDHVRQDFEHEAFATTVSFGGAVFRGIDLVS